ncbi:MAG: nuclear transport factor 2 family protein [Candidatus Heimdallarchaeota archaeon]|nr:nuclear transport factor 2 family protein [Candidatus Heimdallarchaeota archaeon]MCK4769270.1 nuclear transport factor 2 family protein [Candidatus Heimdallarchaeota archaeon]
MFDVEVEKAKIVQLLQVSVEAENSRNIEGALKIYDQDCYSLAPEMKLMKGHSDLRGLYKVIFESLVHMENEVIDIQFSENGDIAYMIASYHMVLKGDEGNVDQIGKFLGTLSNKSGEWKIVAIAYNTDE